MQRFLRNLSLRTDGRTDGRRTDGRRATDDVRRTTDACAMTVALLAKSSRAKNENFMLGNEELKNTHSYAYLGVELSKSGSSKVADQALHKRALRAWFKMKN